MSRTAPPTERRPALWLVAIIGAISLLSLSAGSPLSASTFATSYLPADGFRLRLVQPTVVRSVEWARGTASDLIPVGPIASLVWLVKQKVDLEVPLARVSTVASDASGATHRSDDFLFTDGGLRTAVETQDNASYRIYTPARLDLPNAITAGRSWTSDGQVAVKVAGSGERTSKYHAEYSASTPSTHDELVRRCVIVSMRLAVDGAAQAPTTRTWCPGLGVIAVTDAQGTFVASEGNLNLAPAAPRAFNWAAAGSLTFSPHVVAPNGDDGMSLVPMIPPALLADGVLVSTQLPSAHVVGLDTRGVAVRILWRARPGVRTTAMVGLDDRVVAANTERQLVAYDRVGRWLWQASLPDIAVAPPVRLGDAVVVASLDGSVSAYDLGSGRQLWSHRLSAEIRLAPQVVGDRVVAVDQTGEVSCLDSHGVLQWSQQLDTSQGFAVTTGAHPVVVVRSRTAIWATALSLADGSQVWRTPVRLSARTMLGLDGQLVVVDRNQAIGLDATSGTVEWTWSGDDVYAAAGGANHLLLVGLNKVRMLDAAGRQVQDWVTDVGATETNAASVIVGPASIAVVGPHAVFVGETR